MMEHDKVRATRQFIQKLEAQTNEGASKFPDPEVTGFQARDYSGVHYINLEH